MPRNRRVVLTGIGLVSPLGLDLPTFRQALREGRTGIRGIRGYDASPLEVRIASEVENFDGRNYVEKKDRKLLKTMARVVQMSVACARLALADSRLDPATLAPDRIGVTLGVSTIPGTSEEIGPAMEVSCDPESGKLDLQRWGRSGMATLQPMWMLSHVPNMLACHVSILHNAQGPNNSITQSDVGGLLALTESVNVLQRDAADVMLTGGADSRVSLELMVRYPLFCQLSHRNDAPEKACRPFDRDRDGQVLGEGGSILVVEELEHARRRGAPIYAEVLGSASGFDRGREGAGLARVIQTALSRAGVSPEDLDHVNAHAPGTTIDDAWEARALAAALGEERVGVLALKSYLGNLGAGGSTTELAGSLLALEEGWRPGTLNHEETAPDCPVFVLREPGTVRRPCVLKIATTDRGQCAVVVLRRWDRGQR